MLRKRTLIMIAVVIVVVIGLAVALLLSDQSFLTPGLNPAVQDNLNAGVNQPVDNQLPVDNQPELTPPALTQTEQALTTVARNFAERFGSFSTDSDYANLAEVKLLASARVSAQLDRLMTAEAGAQYYGVSSKVLKVEITNLDESQGEAAVTVVLQREETNARQQNLVYYQELYLTFISSAGNWLVDSYNWQVLD